jgi:hypothetical protein
MNNEFEWNKKGRTFTKEISGASDGVLWVFNEL